MKTLYMVPLCEEIRFAAGAVLAQSPNGNLNDMPGDDIFG